MEKKENYIYFEVHASIECEENKSGLKEVNLITSDEHFARFIVTSSVNLGYTSVSFDRIECAEELVL